MSRLSQLHEAIEHALTEPTPERFRGLAQLRLDTAKLAERVRMRAARLVRRMPARRVEVLAARDALTQAIYRADAPRGWHTAWCDGTSLVREETRLGAIGVLLFDPEGAVVALLSQRREARDAFEAELAALEAALRLARAHGAERLRAHTDCAAAARLWRSRRRDPRLAPVRAAARKLRRFELRAVPRAHNQPAHRLAREALASRPG